VSRRDANIALGVTGVGVFLAGLELMITAVALPAIVAHVSEQVFGAPDWRVLRTASWIVNGYLLVYVVVMPLAGRLVDRWGIARTLGLGLVLFTLGSALAGAAPTLESLVTARLVQGAGGGMLVPVATATAALLFVGRRRDRALGIVGALTFLGMAAGPFVGAAILTSIHPDEALAAAGIGPDATLAQVAAPAWRWIFYLNVPIGIALLAVVWAVAPSLERPERRPGDIDLLGGLLVGSALGLLLLGLSTLGSPDAPSMILLIAAGVVATVAVLAGLRRPDPFLDPRLFRAPAFAAASAVSALTGYGFATAIIGVAVFVDRVLYGGPDDQRLVLGALAAATAAGALAAGWLVRVAGSAVIAVVGIAVAAVALAVLAVRADPALAIGSLALTAAIFGLGFGLSVTPRSVAAVEAVGRAAYGVASSTVTVARMVGMAVGLAVLTAAGSTAIDRLTERVYATPDAWRELVPPELRDRPLEDGLVVEALEGWAAAEASRILVPIFAAGAVVTAVAVLPGLALGGRARMLPSGAADVDGAAGEDDGGEREPTYAI
jgi:MFS family permease